MIEQALTTPVRAGESAEILNALRDARASLQQFLHAFRSPKPNQRSFHVKLRLEVNGSIEQVWVTDLKDLNSETVLPSGVLANEGRLAGLRFGKRVSFQKSEIVDWMYMQDGEMIGGFTNKALLRARRRASSIARLESLTKKWHANASRGLN